MIIFAGIALVLLLSIFLFYKKNFSNTKSHNTSQGNTTAGGRKDSDASLSLTNEEKVELSWQFLYKITDIVLKTFSKEDKLELEQVGRILVNNNMNYQHIVDVSKEQMRSFSLNKEQNKSAGISK